jgi:small subunit ribosomal protein S2
MSETTADPSATAEGAEGVAAATGAGAEGLAAALQQEQLSVRSLLEAGVHFGHQTRRWNPRMRHYIFGERNGIHILDLDQSLPMFEEALDFVRQTVAEGGKLLFVATKKQAAPVVELEARRAKQFYVNNRWLGGMLTNWKTVKKSIERYKTLLDVVGDEEKKNELSKKELARVNRQIEKYSKSLQGIIEMSRLPDAVFVIDVGREEIAVSEARRLGIPIVAVVDTNCNPDGVDFVIPGNDDSIRAVSLYCRTIADACVEGEALHQERLRSETKPQAASEEAQAAPGTGRRVVEIRQAPRRGRGTGRATSFGGRRPAQEVEEAPPPESAKPEDASGGPTEGA